MAVELNHTIVSANDAATSAQWLSELLELPEPTRFGHFWVVQTTNGVSLDFIDDDADFDRIHYAFLVSEDDFDRIFGRIVERAMDHWADPSKHLPRQINHHDGGRGVYFESPDGHFLEIITRPYGSADG
jgi:catechol 2,3-dioxygenase-like lactoylglutathione lyase family enzyme